MGRESVYTTKFSNTYSHIYMYLNLIYPLRLRWYYNEVYRRILQFHMFRQFHLHHVCKSRLALKKPECRLRPIFRFSLTLSPIYVFPVPGGPWITANSFVSAICIALYWESSSSSSFAEGQEAKLRTGTLFPWGKKKRTVMLWLKITHYYSGPRWSVPRAFLPATSYIQFLAHRGVVYIPNEARY